MELNQYHKSEKAPFIIYGDLESLIEKINERKDIENKYDNAEVNIAWKGFVSS